MKTSCSSGIGGRRRRGRQKIRWLDGITDSMDVSLGGQGVGRSPDPAFLSLPALDVGVDRRYTKSLSFLVGHSLSLTDAGAVLIPPGSTTEMGWDVPGVDLIASLLDVQLFTLNLACL